MYSYYIVIFYALYIRYFQKFGVGWLMFSKAIFIQKTVKALILSTIITI